jgi:hypothetical protein
MFISISPRSVRHGSIRSRSVLDPAGSVVERGTTVKELQEHVEPFIAAYNETAEPFAWTKISGASKNLRITQL